MKNLTDYINESIHWRKENEILDGFVISSYVKVDGLKGKLLGYNYEKISPDTPLDYGDAQFVFKGYCYYHWGISYKESSSKVFIPLESFNSEDIKKHKCDFYFDDDLCIDGQTDDAISEIKLDSSMTFEEAKSVLEKHFKIKSVK